jgi:uncharacterized membrane protein YtjA (UPF0391 family)
MTPPAIRRLLIGVLVTGAVMHLVTLALTVHVKTTHPGVPTYDYLGEAVVGGVIMYTLALLLVLRRPEHPVTWALVASGFFGSIQVLLGSYSVEALLALPGQLPFGRLALAGSGIAQTWFVLGFMLMVNLFPTGRPLTGMVEMGGLESSARGVDCNVGYLAQPDRTGGRRFPAVNRE